MRDESSALSEKKVGETTMAADGSDAPKSFRAPSPSVMAARMRLDQTFQRSDQRDDGVSVASSSRRDPGRFGDPASPALAAIAYSTAVKTTVKASSARVSSPSSPTMPKETTANTLRNLADVAGLTLQDTPPQGPVDSFNHPSVHRPAKTDDLEDAGSVTGSDVDPDMLRAISQLVASQQAAASAQSAATTDIASLTRQIEQMAERRRTPTPRAPLPSSAATRRSMARPSPEEAAPLSPRVQRARAPTQLDLKNNDDTFHVIANLVLQPFKRGATLSLEDRKHLDGAVPKHMRESFVEALRYRLENNCPPGSSQHIHVVTRKCQVLGFDKEGSANPLLSLMSQGSNGAPSQSATKKVVVADKQNSPKAVEPAPPTTKKETKLTAAEILARQQLLAELREASNFMAESKTKEASNFWRNHVMELQGRLRMLQGDSVGGGSSTDEDIMAATRRLLEESQSAEAEKGYVPPTIERKASDTDTKTSILSQSFSNMSSAYRGSFETNTTGSSEYAEGGNLAKGGVMNQLDYLRDLYEMIDLLILLLEIDKLLDFVDAQKIPDKIKDVLKDMTPENMEQYIKDSDLEKYFDPGFLDEQFNKFADKIDVDEFMDDLERKMAPDDYKKMMNDMTRNLLGPEQLREAMNLDEIRKMTDPASLRYYFTQQGLDKVWDLDKLKDLMDSKKLREAIDANNVREVLKSQTMRDFMGNSYRGPNPMVDVVAPSDMPGGYRFEAQIDGHRFVATVPQAGVRKGETFSCMMKDIDSMYSGDIPVGGWRDRLTDFLTNGVCHPVVWMTLFCPLLALAQVMTRLKYDFLGRPRTTDQSSFAVMSSIVIMWITLNAAIFAAYNFKWSQRMELSVADICALVFVNVAMWVFCVYATSATRASIREKYMIREHRFYDLEDCCCATFAMPLTICQMARHTADYTRYEAACCTETGLEEGAELPNTGSNVSASNYFCADAPTGEYWCDGDEKDLV